MIRQLGPATFFMSLSAAETRWAHLLQILSNVVDEKSISELEAFNLTWQEKTRLIQSDPVTCARHFDFCVSKFMSDFIMSSAAPVGQVKDYFYRVEYQQRGSPHIHMMIWCEDVPKYGEDLTGEVIKYIDSFISCRKVDANSELVELVEHTDIVILAARKTKSSAVLGFLNLLFRRQKYSNLWSLILILRKLKLIRKIGQIYSPT